MLKLRRITNICLLMGCVLASLLSCATAGREDPPAVSSKPNISESEAAPSEGIPFEAEPGRAILVFIHVPSNEVIPIAHVSTAVLIQVNERRGHRVSSNDGQATPQDASNTRTGR